MSSSRKWFAFIVLSAIPIVAGCFGSGEPSQPSDGPPTFPNVVLKVGAASDPKVLEVLRSQRGEWVKTRQADVTLVEQAVTPETASGFDIVVLSGQDLGAWLDAEALAELPESVVRPPKPAEADLEAAAESGDPNARPTPPPDPLAFDQVFPAFREQVTKSGKHRHALPLGGSALVLVYRRDAFESPANRQAAEAMKPPLTLEPPSTWEQFDALAKFFHNRDWDGDGEPEGGLAVALGRDADRLGESIYLARAVGAGQPRDQYSFLFDVDALRPRVTSPPFVEALEALVRWKAFGPEGMAEFDGEAARRAFRSGEAAMLIDLAERPAGWTDRKARLAVGVAALPGSGRVYDGARKTWEPSDPPNRPSYLPSGGGWLIAVTSACPPQRREAAIDFIKYLIEPTTAQRVASDRALPMLPVRSSLVDAGLPDPTMAPGVDGRAWAKAVSATLSAPRVVVGLRIPGAGAYLDALGKARTDALAGTPAADALQAAAGTFDAITKDRGAERQLWHYQRSLNAIVTLDQPPSSARK